MPRDGATIFSDLIGKLNVLYPPPHLNSPAAVSKWRPSSGWSASSSPAGKQKAAPIAEGGCAVTSQMMKSVSRRLAVWTPTRVIESVPESWITAFPETSMMWVFRSFQPEKP
jgi:hypothetical protein